jgi:hypothetical protein
MGPIKTAAPLPGVGNKDAVGGNQYGVVKKRLDRSAQGEARVALDHLLVDHVVILSRQKGGNRSEDRQFDQSQLADRTEPATPQKGRNQSQTRHQGNLDHRRNRTLFQQIADEKNDPGQEKDECYGTQTGPQKQFRGRTLEFTRTGYKTSFRSELAIGLDHRRVDRLRKRTLGKVLGQMSFHSLPLGWYSG